MSDAQNIEIMQSYVESLSKGDIATVGQLLADDVIWHRQVHAAE
jgi:ketosteroid isomerase-like protein